MANLQVLFGNPKYKSKGRKKVKKTASKKRNPAKYRIQKGRKVSYTPIFMTTSELNSVKKVKEGLGKEIVKRSKELQKFKGSKSSSVFKRAKQALDEARNENRKLRSLIGKEMTKLKAANKQKKKAVASGAKAKLVSISKEGATVKPVKAKLKKIDDALKNLKGGKVAKKKTTKRKATKKKATRRKVAKKKTTKRKTSTRKTAKKKTAKKATKKKATRRKTAKKTSKKKATRRKTTKRKTSTRRKASKRKTTKRKTSKPRFYTATVKRRKVGSKKAKSYSKAMKSVRSASKKRGGIGKGKKKSIIFKRNPMGGINMKLKKFLKHDVMEAGGLFLGGMGHGAVNDAFARFAPGLSSTIAKIGGNFSGSLLPLLVGIGAGAANKKLKNNYLESFSKGLIGSSVVGIGATAYEIVRPSQAMAGLAHDYDGLNGEYNQLGYEESDYSIGSEYNQMGAIATHSFDMADGYSESEEDFGMEYDNFEGQHLG